MVKKKKSYNANNTERSVKHTSAQHSILILLYNVMSILDSRWWSCKEGGRSNKTWWTECGTNKRAARQGWEVCLPSWSKPDDETDY